MNETRYPGGKGTFYHRIINLMPPHKFYIETHVGGGAVIRHKRPAEINVALDLDPDVKKRWESGKFLHITFYVADAINYLKGIQESKDILIYADPPYMLESRKGGRLYKYEYTDEDHLCLLTRLNEMRECKIIISGYMTPMYKAELRGWNHMSFDVMTRGGKATENLWFNFDFPEKLHEYTYLGNTFRDRERIRRKQRRRLKNLEKMEGLERRAMFDLIKKKYRDDFNS